VYEAKQNSYFRNVRKELLDLIPVQNRIGKVLEIGAGGGDTLLYALENGYAQNIFGVELCEIDNSFQKSHQFDKFIIGNIEQMELPFSDESFDVILCGDVLEHLVDPYHIVHVLRGLLKQDGVLIASIPNIREWHTMREVFFRGDFKYTDSGILDRTHLRFFCKKNIITLFENNGMAVTKIETNIALHGGRTNLLNKITMGIFEEFLTYQYLTVSQKK